MTCLTTESQTMDAAVKPNKESSMLSSATILILSGFLVGLSVAEPLGNLKFHVFAGGAVGFIAFATFETARRRQEKVLDRRDQSLIEERLCRHLKPNQANTRIETEEQQRLLEWLKRETEALSD